MRLTATFPQRATLPLRRLRLGHHWRELLALVGLPVALFGQHLIAHRIDYPFGGILLVLGAALFVAAAQRLPLVGGATEDRAAASDAVAGAAGGADSAAPPGPGLRHWLTGLLPGILLCAAGVALFLARVPASLPWLVWSVGVFFVAVLGWRVAGRPSPRLWPLSELVVVAGITLLGACFRLYRLAELPPGLWWDEAVGGLEAVKILQDPNYRPIYVAGLVNSPSLWFYLSALFVAWLGPIPEAVRSAALLGGIVYPPVIYALARQLFGVRAAIPAAAIAAVLLWNVNFSRNGWNYVWTVSLDALSMALLIRAVQQRRPGAALAGGLVWGLALHGYNPARLVLPIAAAFIVLWGWRSPRRFLRQQATVLVLYALGALLVVAPLVLFAARRPDEYLSRSQQVFIMNEVRGANSWEPLVNSVRQHLLMFNVAGDRNGRHNLPGAPMLDQVTAALFVVGLGLAVMRLRRPEWAILPIWCLIGLAAGALTLAFEAPQALRGIEAMTPAVLLAGAALGAFSVAEQPLTNQPLAGQSLAGRAPTSQSPPAQASPGRPPNARGTSWAPEIVAALLLAVVGLNYHAYFVRKATDFASWAAYSSAEAAVGRQAELLAGTHTVYVEEPWLGHPTIRFLAPSAKELKRLDPATNVPLHDGGPVAVFVAGESPALIEDLDRLYPDGGTDRLVPDIGGPVVVRSAFVPREAIDAARGVNLRVGTGSGGRSNRQTLPSLDLDWGGPGYPFAPADLDLSTTVTAPTFGRYRFEVEGPPDAVLQVNDLEVARVGQPAEVQLARGNHRLRVTALAEAPARLRVLWALPGTSDATPIPADSLFRASQASRGLLATYRRGTSFEAPIELLQIDRQLQRRVHMLPLPRPYSVEWIGRLDVGKAGVHTFSADAIGRSSLWIDDRPLFLDAPGKSEEASIVLSEGNHSIRARFLDTDNFSRFDLLWRPPGGEREPIPTSRLLPPEGIVETPSPAPVPAAPPLAPLGEPVVRWLYSTPPLADVRGVGVGPNGSVYVADGARRIAQRLGEFGQPLGDLTGGIGDEPVDVDVSPDGRPVVLDAGTGVLVRYEADGSRPTQIGGPALGLYRPRGLGIGPDGSIYVANTGGSQIVKIAPDGSVLERFGPTIGGPEEIRQPIDVAVGPDGDLYVTNGERDSIVRLDPSGRYRAHWAIPRSDTSRGPHVAVGPDGGVYVTEPGRGRVVRFTNDGVPAGVVESTRQGRLLRTPIGIAVGADGTVYVADPGLRGVVAVAFTKGGP